MADRDRSVAPRLDRDSLDRYILSSILMGIQVQPGKRTEAGSRRQPVDDPGRPLDTLYDRHPGIRSDHNHYLALPVVFLMLGSHLPIAYNHPYGWIAISVCVLAAGLIKHAHSLQQAEPGPPLSVSLGAYFVLPALHRSQKSGQRIMRAASRRRSIRSGK